MTNDPYKDKLDPEAYAVLREGGTERAFTGKYYDHNEDGMYHCGACGVALFSSTSKYHSDAPGLAGWPSFNDPVDRENVELREDNSFGMRRTEVVCKHCGSHLGHVFDEAESKTGKHYCINSCALNFEPKSDEK